MGQFWLHCTKYASTPDGSTTYQYGNGEVKNEGYVSTYETNELDLSKVVDGDLANKNPDAFDFTIEISGLTAGSTIGVSTDGSKYDDETATNGSVKLENVKLGNGEHYYVCGLPTGATVKVTENIQDSEGYTTSYKFNNGSKTDGKEASNLTIADKDNSQANTVEFTNKKEAISPTGIVMDIAPYALLVAVAAAGCFVFLRKRRED